MRALRRSFSTPANAVLTLVTVPLILALATPFVRWALIDATWTGTSADCRASSGACWAFIGHKLSFIIFGLYPSDQRWHAAAATIVLLTLVVVTLTPRFWRSTLLLAWAVGLGV